MRLCRTKMHPTCRIHNSGGKTAYSISPCCFPFVASWTFFKSFKILFRIESFKVFMLLIWSLEKQENPDAALKNRKSLDIWVLTYDVRFRCLWIWHYSTPTACIWQHCLSLFSLPRPVSYIIRFFLIFIFQFAFPFLFDFPFQCLTNIFYLSQLCNCAETNAETEIWG